MAKKHFILKIAFSMWLVQLFSSYFLFSQDRLPGDVCKDVLVANAEYHLLERRAKLAWLKLINQQNFAELVRSAGGSITFEGLGLGGTWEEFQSNRQSLFTKENYYAEEDEAFATVRYNVPDSARAAWVECIRTVYRAPSPTQDSLQVVVTRENKLGADILILWNPYPAVAKRVESQSIIGGMVLGLSEGKWLPSKIRLEPGGSHQALIIRNGTSEIRGNLTVGGISKSFYITAAFQPSHSVKASFKGSGSIVEEYFETFDVRLKHHQCTNTQYWREYKLRSDDSNRRPTHIASVITLPLPSGELAPYGCFQVVDHKSDRDPDGLPHGILARLLYNECAAIPMLLPSRITIPNDARSQACQRGITEGTPIRIVVAGKVDKQVSIPEYSNQGLFDRFKSWTYPDDLIPAGVNNCTFQVEVNVTNLETGVITTLSNSVLNNNGFRLVIENSGKSIVLIRDQMSDNSPDQSPGLFCR